MTNRVMWLGCAALAGFGLAVQAILPLHYDVTWFLLLGHRLLHGAVLGVDVVEINPPLFAYLSIPVAWLGERLGTSDAAAVRIMSTLALVVVLALTWNGLRAAWPDRLARWFTLVAAVALFVLPGEQFGQREHLILAGMLPYTIVSAMRVRRSAVPISLALAAGGLMAIAVAIKPFFALAWCGLEAWLLWRGAGAPWRRPEGLLTALGLMAYALLVPWLWPGYAFWLRLLAPTYWAYHHVSFVTALLIWPWMPVAILSWGLATAPGADHPDPLATSLTIVGGSSLGAAILQAKGWENHYLPAAAFTGLLLLVLTSAAKGSGRYGRIRHFAARVLGGMIATLVVIRVLLLFSAESGELESIPDLQRWLQDHTSAGDTIAVLTGVPFTPVRLAAATGTVLATRFQNLWPLASLESSSAPLAKAQGVEAAVFDATVSDLVQKQPAIIAIRPRGGELPRLNLLEYFTRSTDFRRLITAYDSVGVMDGYGVWQRARGE